MQVPVRRVLVVHGDIYDFGGAENTAVKIVKILQDLELDVTVIHAGGPLDVEGIKNWIGIALDPERVRFVQAWPFRIVPHLFAGWVLLRYALVLRAARRIASRFDLVIGSYGDTPIRATRLIQTVHVPLFFYDRESLHYLGVRGAGRAYLAVRAGYVLLSRWIGGWSRNDVERGMLLTSTHWTSRQMLRHYPSAKPRTIYHGATTGLDARSPEYLPHDSRRNGIVILGRIVPFKRVEMAIAIVDGLRALGHDVGLTVVGNGTGPYADECGRQIDARPHARWYRNLSRSDMERLVVEHRWGLHCAEFEHYGLAAIELQRLGCVTFVHDSGGQTEVVTDPALRYSDIEDAIAKMGSVLSSHLLARRLFDALPAAVALHSVAAHRSAFVECLGEAGVTVP